jgi:arsenate reductase
MSNKGVMLLPTLQAYTDRLVQEFIDIPDDRRILLNELTRFIQDKLANHQPVYLNFICTHNSRRSHVAQLWAQTAARYFGVKGVHCFSGGTEATAFNPRAVKAMQNVGFDIHKTVDGDNPVYEVRFAKNAPPVISFSKKYNDPFNHHKDFAAIMTCSQADENCPLIVGASARIPITYDDPKDFDSTALEAAKYKERVQQIGREMLFTFSQVKA